MKQHIFTILAVVALIFCNCDDVFALQAEQSAGAKDPVVKLIWKWLKAEDMHISKVVAKAEALDKARYEGAEQLKSKTALDFNFEMPKSNGVAADNFLARYQMQCYQKKDGSWLAVVVCNVKADTLDGVSISDCNEILVVRYMKGAYKYLRLKDVFPLNFNTVIDYFGTECSPKIVLGETEIYCYSAFFSPLKYVWNGNRFQSTSAALFNCMMPDGSLSLYYPYNGSYDNVHIGDAWIYRDDVLLSSDGQKVARLTIKAGEVDGYTLLSRQYGIAMEWDDEGFITGKPVALGSPIKYAIDHKLNDAFPVVTSTREGQFVVTQQLAHDTKRSKRDLFVEYSSMGEKLPIENICVYSKPIDVTLQGTIECADNLSDDAKKIFLELDFNQGDYGEYLRVFTYKNGCLMKFASPTFDPETSYYDYDTEVQFRIYDAGGKYLVVLSPQIDFVNLGAKYWYYQNGTFTPAEITLPSPKYNGRPEDCSYDFTDDGFLYYHDLPKGAPVLEHFRWDGKGFVPCN